jgi:hypothetical protein
MKNIIYCIWVGIIYIFVPLLLMNGIGYIVVSFIAQDTDPRNWFLLARPEGRIIFVGLQFLFVCLRNDFWRKFK